MTVIKISELETIFSKIIEKLKFEAREEISIEDDFYKFIPTDEWSSFTGDIIETGSLSDDIDNLKKLVQDKHHPCTYVDFDRLASVLRAISQNMNPV